MFSKTRNSNTAGSAPLLGLRDLDLQWMTPRAVQSTLELLSSARGRNETPHSSRLHSHRGIASARGSAPRSSANDMSREGLRSALRARGGATAVSADSEQACKKKIVQKEFHIFLDKGQAKQESRIGINVHGRTGSRLKISNIQPGLVTAWNSKHLDREVKVGDFIMAANGMEGNAEEMYTLIAKQAKLELIIRREIDEDIAAVHVNKDQEAEEEQTQIRQQALSLQAVQEKIEEGSEDSDCSSEVSSDEEGQLLAQRPVPGKDAESSDSLHLADGCSPAVANKMQKMTVQAAILPTELPTKSSILEKDEIVPARQTMTLLKQNSWPPVRPVEMPPRPNTARNEVWQPPPSSHRHRQRSPHQDPTGICNTARINSFRDLREFWGSSEGKQAKGFTSGAALNSARISLNEAQATLQRMTIAGPAADLDKIRRLRKEINDLEVGNQSTGLGQHA